MYSREGYRRNSPDKNNPYNIIPSGNISMKNVDHPVLGIDEYGNMKWMMPNEDYQFPGNTVLEIPYMQPGGPIYVDSPSDPRYMNYQDSLNIHNYSEKNYNKYLKLKESDKRNTNGVGIHFANWDSFMKNDMINYEPILLDLDKRNKKYTEPMQTIKFDTYDETGSFYNTGHINRFAKPKQPVFIKGTQQAINAEKQTILKEQGLYTGKIDGDWGPLSKDAWTKYQSMQQSKPVEEVKVEQPVQQQPNYQPKTNKYTVIKKEGYGFYDAVDKKEVRNYIAPGQNERKIPYYEIRFDDGTTETVSYENYMKYYVNKKLQQGGTAGMDGMIKARLAIDSHFGNPTARRMTNYDTRSYEFPDGNKGNVYVSSYDNLVTPQIQDVNGELMFINNPWSKENADRSYNQSMKFEREEDARYFGENYKKYAPMMNLYKKQEGGEMNEEIIRKIQEALQQGITPEQLIKELQKQGITEQEAIQLVSAAMPQQEEMQQYQYGTTVRHNYADNINFNNKFNATALGLNAVSDPRNMTWALPNTGFGSELKAISGLASGLAGSYLGYAKLFSKDKTTDITPVSAINKISSAQIQAPYMNTDSEKALPTPWGKGYDLPKELNPYSGQPNIQGTNQYSTYQKGGMKKYQWAGEYYDNPVNKKTTMGNPLINNLIPSPEIYNFDIGSLTPQGNTQQTNQNSEFSNIQNPWLVQYNDRTNPNPPRQYIRDTVPEQMQRQSYQNYFPGATIDEGSIAMDNYINQNIYPTNSVNSLNKTSEQLKKEKQNKPTITSMNDDALGFMIANNALIGFQNFNDVLSARDYEKEYNQMLMRTGNSDQRYNPINPINPYGMYTPNAGIGSNYGLVANSHPQDFGTKLASAKCGGMKKKYKEGGEYNLTQEEIDYILKNGGEIEILD